MHASLSRMRSPQPHYPHSLRARFQDAKRSLQMRRHERRICDGHIPRKAWYNINASARCRRGLLFKTEFRFCHKVMRFSKITSPLIWPMAKSDPRRAHDFVIQGDFIMLTPENEMGVIALFAAGCVENGWELLRIGSAFPDAFVRDTIDGKEYRVEFEYKASNFIQHGHDPMNCDLIVCWEDDIKIEFPILEVRTWDRTKVFYLTEGKRNEAFLTVTNRKLQSRINELARKVEELETALSRSGASKDTSLFTCKVCGRENASQRQLAGHMNAHRKAGK